MDKKIRKFKVIALSVGGRGNKIFHSNQEVSEFHFPEGAVDELVRHNFLQEINPEIVEVKDKKISKPEEKPVEVFAESKVDDDIETMDYDVTEQDMIDHAEFITDGIKVGDIIQIPKTNGKLGVLPEGALKIFIDKNGVKREVKSIDDITKPELIFSLKQKEVEFSATSDRKTLYDLWLKSE